MTSMRKVILQVELDPHEASVSGVQLKLDLEPEQIDASFGVKQLRPGQNAYAIRVDADVAEAVRGERSETPQSGEVSVALVH